MGGGLGMRVNVGSWVIAGVTVGWSLGSWLRAGIDGGVDVYSGTRVGAGVGTNVGTDVLGGGSTLVLTGGGPSTSCPEQAAGKRTAATNALPAKRSKRIVEAQE